MVWKILSALSAVCLGIACYFAWSNQKLLVEERKREAYTHTNLTEIKAHIAKAVEAKAGSGDLLATVTQELAAIKATVADYTSKVQTAEQELAVVKTNLEQATKVVSQNQKQIEEAGDIKSLIAQIESLKKERAEAESALSNQTQHLAAAQERITNLTNAAKEAEEREARGRRGIVDDDFTAKVAHAYTDWGFVVLNKGNGGGVFANADLEVKRGKDVVAKLKVRDVEQNSSVAELVKGSLAEGEHLRSGDLVVAAAEQSAKITPVKTPDEAAAPAPGAPAGSPAPAMESSDPFGAPTAPAPAMGSDPFGAPAAPAPAPAMGADPFGATPPAGATPPPSTADPFGAAPANK
ncbi:MAG: hypothetical protein B7Z37_11795 [Verrucomicrobia bacterium 12-59-8]|nr:MAG: hypothetical protein B7Z37_11795 [Verrucomicrobia bacterium 12-59-8]